MARKKDDQAQDEKPEGLAGHLWAAFKKGTLFKGNADEFNQELLSCGLLPMDWALGGGWIRGALAEIIGPWQTGKSLLGYLSLIAAQNRGDIAALAEAEGAYSPEFFGRIGGNAEALLLSKPETVEEFFENLSTATDAVKKSQDNTPLVMLWDSIALTGTRHLMKEGVDGSRDMTKAFQMSQGTAYTRPKVREAKMVVIATNQLRTAIGDDNEQEAHTPGGVAWPYACSQRVELNWAGGFKGSRLFNPEDDHEVVGRWIRGKVIKNRAGPPQRQFKFPLFLEEDRPHPEFVGLRTTFGIDIPHALFCFYQSLLVGEGLEQGAALFANGGWWKWHAKVREKLGGLPESMRGKDFPQVLKDHPNLNDYSFVKGLLG